jgi:O-6-methylguanine DNA methyltransferase
VRATIDTTIGPLGIEQNDRGLSRVILGARADLSGDGGAWGERLRAHLLGERVSFDDLPIDTSAWSPFAARVYDAAKRIPRGVTVTYADLAREIDTVNARAVGVALGKNPIPIVVPCHRIVGKDDAGGFSAPGGASTKAQLLAIEGGALDDESHRVARRHLMRVDKELAPIVKKTSCTLPVRPSGNLFRTIVRAIAGQQLSTKAAATIFLRLETALGVSARWPDDAAARVLSTDEATLRGVGLSNAKTASVRDLATRVVNGSLDLERITRLPDEAVIERLCEVRGIGRWTAEMLLIFDLGRPDVLPVDDLGIRKGVQRVYRLRALPEAPAIVKRAEAWRPFRSIGSWYLWRSLDGVLF